ncbi:hypothetical protein KL936_000251 [Ogataea polymorpha]|nr:hypothetical protein KL936_000251 [Ogataea polymorpha]
MNSDKTFQMPPMFGSVKSSRRSSSELSQDNKSVPAELTLNGTTPSGKPRLYVCNICTRAFARQEHLKRHERSHTKEKPFACTICSRKFSRRDLLLRHSTKLHAGAAEVVPRLRRRSVKSTSSPASKDNTDQSASNSPSAEPAGRAGLRRGKRGSFSASASAVTKPTPSARRQRNSVPVAVEQRIKEVPELHDDFSFKGLKDFDYKLEFPVNRRASFSAMSGRNYAMPTPEPYATEAVEFSTPQLIAFDDDSEQWLNSLPNLDLMDHSDSQVPMQTSSSLNADAMDVSPHEFHEDITGYSFYDVPYKNVGSLFTHTALPNRGVQAHGLEELVEGPLGPQDRPDVQPFKAHVSPLVQESPATDSSLNTQPGDEKVKHWQETLFNQSINDLEEIADLNVSKTYDVPQGYSFYGNSDHNTVPHSSSCSSNATISPILLDNTLSANSRQNSPNQTLENSQKQGGSKTYSDKEFNSEFAYSKDKFEKYSRVNLFTGTIRNYVYQSLSKYPFLGVPSPTIPDNEKLNHYTHEFKNKFLNHHPFIHKSMLNEYSLMKSTLCSIESNLIRDENSIDNTRVSLVCLPLLIATIGAIVSNRKSDAANLYEASRRCIHVYLETRKKLVRHRDSADENVETQTNNSSPLWLIQALTLSVVYGLFADDETSLNVIIRQVNALCSLVKSSGLNSVSSQLPINIDDDETSHEKFIENESTIRTVHMIFHISSLLSTLYNIVPSLKIDDLKTDLPSSTFLWECTSHAEFKNILESFDFRPENYHRVLRDLINLPFAKLDPSTGLIGKLNFFFDNHVSEYGLVCLQNGLHQLAYLKQLYLSMPEGGNVSDFLLQLGSEDQKLLNVAQNWENLLKACKLYQRNSEVFIDAKLLNSYLNLKLSHIMNFNKIKENVWLRSFSDINSLYENSFIFTDDQLKDSQYQKELIGMLDNCIDIFKTVFFQQPADSELENSEKQLKEIYDEELGIVDLNFLMKLSIDSQLLLDIFMIIVKFLINFENIFKMKMKYNSLGSVSLIQHFELRSTVYNPSSSLNTDVDETVFKYYKKFFKIYLNLEYFLKINYDYHDFESDFSSLTISNIINRDTMHYSQQEKNLNSILKDDLEVLREKDLIINELIEFKLPFKFLKIGSFLFNFIYDKNFKFVNFKNLSDVLFHLRVFLENRDDFV